MFYNHSFFQVITTNFWAKAAGNTNKKECVKMNAYRCKLLVGKMNS